MPKFQPDSIFELIPPTTPAAQIIEQGSNPEIVRFTSSMLVRSQSFFVIGITWKEEF
jgi:hypothetical protein